MKKIIKQQNGVTLIALIITIIVLLIIDEDIVSCIGKTASIVVA